MTETSSGSPDRPVVLLVEDNERSRIARSELFAHEGMQVIEVDDLESAIAALGMNRDISVVVTDISLSSRETNTDGLRLVELIRDRFHGLPVVGYSALFAEGDVPVEYRHLFDRWYPKGSLSSLDIADSVTEAKRLALEYDRNRRRGT